MDGNAIGTGNPKSFKATGVGKHTVVCTCYFQQGFYMAYIQRTVTVAAIGGPLSTSVTPGFGSGGQAPIRDQRDSTQPWYIQYLGYTYDPNVAKPDIYAQTPQIGQAQAPGQLGGTTYAWSVVGNAVLLGPPTSQDASVSISASGSSGTGSIRAKCTFRYTDPTDSTLTGSTDDDTEEMPDALARRFTAHLPSTLAEVGHTTVSSPYEYHAIMRLKDHLGQKMAGVIVQERFPYLASEVRRHGASHLPSDEHVNGPSEAWVTVPAYSGGTLIDDGIFGGIDPNSGNYLPAYDGFSLSLPYASDPSGPGTWPNSSHPGDPWVILTQRYFAATSNPANGAFGIDLGSWTISKWTDLITHN